MIKDAVALGRALSDPGRVRVLHALSSGEMCLCQLVELLDLAPSTVSRHMTLLLQAGLVARRKEGRWHHYRLREDEADIGLSAVLGWVAGCSGDDPQILRDTVEIRRLRRMDRSELTACYRS